MIYIDETRTQKKIIIRKNEDSIIIKVKHIQIFTMMIQTHYGKFSDDCNFGKHEVVKRENGLTIVKKKGCSDFGSKYAIGKYDNGDRLYGLNYEDHIEVSEDECTKLILQLDDYYITLSNGRTNNTTI